MKRWRRAALAICLSVGVTGGSGQTNNRARELPSWFKDLDTDGDGQLSLYEWRLGGKNLDDFRRYDRDGDGFITAEELLRVLRMPIALKLQKGHASYNGVIETGDQRYQGKKLAKIFTVQLERDTTYQIDHRSRAFDAYLYLEDSQGNVLAEDDDGGGNLNSRIVGQVGKSGTYRLIATSLNGAGAGAFSLSVASLSGGARARMLPSWFKELDRNRDGQISIFEWRQGGKKLEEFREYDRNGDGFITREEVFLALDRPIVLKLEDGQVTYQGRVEEPNGEMYLGKRTYTILTITLERDRTYRFALASKDFYAYLYLENSQGKVLREKNSGGKGSLARFVHRAAESGTYRLIATSQDGVRTGAFSLSVRVKEEAGP
jgi:Ca2+-binding EF-hand superfamily protein